MPEQSEEGGVPVMMGEVPDAWGAADPSLVEVDVMPEETAPEMPEEVEQDMLTQEEEETVAIKPKAEEKRKKRRSRRRPQRKKQRRPESWLPRKRNVNGRLRRKLPANVLREPLARVRRWEVRALRKGRCARKPYRKFFVRSDCRNRGYGTFNLGGRSIGEGGLPRPVYNVQDEESGGYHYCESGRTGHCNQHQPTDQYGESRFAEGCGRCGKESAVQYGKWLEQPDRNDYVLF